MKRLKTSLLLFFLILACHVTCGYYIRNDIGEKMLKEIEENALNEIRNPGFRQMEVCNKIPKEKCSLVCMTSDECSWVCATVTEIVCV